MSRVSGLTRDPRLGIFHISGFNARKRHRRLMSAQLLAFITAISYASALVSARRGLRYSTPATVTLVSIVMQNLLLWSAVVLDGRRAHGPMARYPFVQFCRHYAAMR